MTDLVQYGVLFAYPIGNAVQRRLAEKNVRQSIPPQARQVAWFRRIPAPDHMPGWRCIGAKWYTPKETP